MGAWESLHVDGGGTMPAQWRNLGYWTDQTTSLDQACRHMASRLADSADVKPDCDVLDVGCGPGESTFLLHERLIPNGTAPPSRLVGMDITQRHIDMALSRRTGTSPEFVCGDATDIPFPAESFDRVLALECAFHFPDRRRFFTEAFRVLRPRGRIGIADVLPTTRADAIRRRLRSFIPGPLRGRVDRYFADIMKTPEVNLVTVPEYTMQLRAAGYTDVVIENINDRVFPYFAAHWQRGSRSDGPERILRRDGDRDMADTRAKAWRRQMRIFASQLAAVRLRDCLRPQTGTATLASGLRVAWFPGAAALGEEILRVPYGAQ